MKKKWVVGGGGGGGGGGVKAPLHHISSSVLTLGLAACQSRKNTSVSRTL